MTFTFSLSSPFWFSLQSYLKIALPTQFFGYFIFPFKKWVELGEGGELYVLI